MSEFGSAATLLDRMNALPEPYRSNLIEWFRCGLDWSIHAPCEGLINLADLLRTAPLGHLVQLKQVLGEAEHCFGGLTSVTNPRLRQTMFSTRS